MIRVSIAQRYARALFDVEPNGTLGELAEALDAMGQAYRSSPELQAVMENPAIGGATRHQVLELLIGKLHSPPTAANLFRLLIDRGRMGYVEAIAHAFRDQLDARTQRVRAKVTSATELDEATVTTLQKNLAHITGKTVTVEKTVDKRLLGGVIAQVGSLTFDGSLASQLQSLRRQLAP